MMDTATKTTADASVANAGKGGAPAGTKDIPAEKQAEVRATKRRRPMSVPTRRLEATAIPGYHLHWVRQENIPQALQAAYEFVLDNEVEVNTRNVAVDSAVGATSDLSNRVSVQFGGDTLYLMKLDEALYREDMAELASRNREVWQAIFRNELIAGTAGQNPGDTSNSYVKEATIEGGATARATNAFSRNNKPLFSREFK